MPIGGTAGMATAASAYEVQTVAALINFFHMSLGSPSIPEWINSINRIQAIRFLDPAHLFFN
jgi:hypothetical protein